MEVPLVLYHYLTKTIGGGKRKEKAVRLKMDRFRIPERLKPLILKELEELGLIERISDKVVKLKTPCFDESLKTYYEVLEVWKK